MTPHTALAALDVLVLDFQATAAAPLGHLLEIGWAVAGPRSTPPETRLIALPAGTRVPPAVARITGISDAMLGAAVCADVAWTAVRSQAAQLQAPVPTVIHYARFERRFLDGLCVKALDLDVVCTHEIAMRLLPDLPRRSLRALAGYFGAAVGTLRRSAQHVDATAFVWRELVGLLAYEGVSTWPDLRAWLAAPIERRRRAHRVYPMPRDARLALPDAPGVYRLLRTTGDILYIGKATSLRERVNSHFRHQRGVHERALEMLSQARAISFHVTASAVEAALLEADEIKRHRPPYNVALQTDARAVWFARPDLGEHGRRPSTRLSIGPLPSAETLEQFAALTCGLRSALGHGRWGPDATTFSLGYERFLSELGAVRGKDSVGAAALLGLGMDLWRQGRRDRDTDADEGDSRDRPTWTPEMVQLSLEWLVIRAALAKRRAAWFIRLMDGSILWTEPGSVGARMIEIANGEIASCAPTDHVEPTIPAGYKRPAIARQQAVTLARFDRLRVLTTELKRLSAARAHVAVRLGAAPALAGARLAAALSWL